MLLIIILREQLGKTIQVHKWYHVYNQSYETKTISYQLFI